MLPAVRRGRPAYPDVLTPREWEVLALIREGLTNEQIAQRLGITESGARFHVSEILSKLGVESRQEAAGWRAPRKPFALGGLLTKWGAAAVVAAAVLALVLLAIGVLAMNRRTSDGNSVARQTPDKEELESPLPLASSGAVVPFHMEVAVTFGGPQCPSARDTVSRWYQATNLWREERLDSFCERDSPGTMRQSKGITIVDGRTAWHIAEEAKTYYRMDYGGAAQWEVQHLAIPNMFGIGPTNCSSLDDLVKYIDLLTHSARVVGQEDVRGVPTQIIEYDPTRSLSTDAGRMWVDPSGKKAVILRHEHTGLDGGGWTRADVTSISYGEPVHESLLAFQPESGMTEVPGPRGSAPPQEPQAIQQTCLPTPPTR
jgi:DNA-binding CsgD family transcriptional regulator